MAAFSAVEVGKLFQDFFHFDFLFYVIYYFILIVPMGNAPHASIRKTNLRNEFFRFESFNKYDVIIKGVKNFKEAIWFFESNLFITQKNYFTSSSISKSPAIFALHINPVWSMFYNCNAVSFPESFN